jgi:nicotinamide-nucleotide amidase
MDTDVYQLASQVGDLLTETGHVLATAESCTGGWVSQAITAISGSSGFFDRGFVTYSNQAKQEMLGVRAETLRSHGAVSAEVVEEMVTGALGRSGATVALAISGIAGPGGGTADKPVGTVWFAWGVVGLGVTTERIQFQGGREAVRHQAVITALQGVIRSLG